MYNDRPLTCLFVLINFEVLFKWSLNEQLKHPLQHIFLYIAIIFD